MKKNLPLALAMLTLPLVITGCRASIGDTGGATGLKETYTMKNNDYLTIRYLNNKVDVFTTEQYHNETTYDGSHYWIKGNFTIKLTYWEMGIDVKVSGLADYSDITFVYRGAIDYQLLVYGTVQNTSPDA